MLLYFYKIPIHEEISERTLQKLRKKGVKDIISLQTEYCFYVECSNILSTDELNILKWLLADVNEELTTESSLKANNKNSFIIEVGPRLNFETSWSSNAVSICCNSLLNKITRIERSRRYKFYLKKNYSFKEISILKNKILPFIHDRMTECVYPERLNTFISNIKPEPVKIVPLIQEGPEALRKINKQMGLGLDEQDIQYYYKLFVEDLKRNPTDVECFDLGQSNSEHSRHWFFKGKLIIDSKEVTHTLMELIKEPLKKNPLNSVIAFKDNSSAIKGYRVKTIIPENPFKASAFVQKDIVYHPIFTAETHNFPTGVAPYPGAETGTGGRIRDVHATGRGSLVIAGTAGYCVGNLRITGYELPWEDKSFSYPSSVASALDIEIEASNGASDYGNKFGEPIIQGFTRSFGIRLPDGQRWEWIKPIMFTAGVGQIDNRHTEKLKPEKGMLIVKIGGPAYRIGIGGGAASSMIQGENVEELDFSAVQRGDAEMEQKLNRVIRACVEMEDKNPILSIHDQGAGGNSNLLKEIVYPEGARIQVRKILLGDKTLSVLEIWGSEYQENDAILIKKESLKLFQYICEREKLPFSVIGEVTGDGYIILYDEQDDTTPVSLPLAKVLGEMPQKRFELKTKPTILKPLKLPKDLTIREALNRVLRLLSVGSKRFLTTKVDRSVTGLIVQQQCVGPLQLPLSDVAVVAQSHFSTTGIAISIGEQPIKTLLNPASMARLTVAEALTNLVWAKITTLKDVKCSGNWMWAPKLPGEGVKLYQAVKALRDVLLKLEIAIDGGKDSLSMAAIVKNSSHEEIVKSPGTLVISAYAPCPDINKVITPDIKEPEKSKLMYINISKEKYRLGGSALSQTYAQVGKDGPDLEDPFYLKKVFNTLQKLIFEDLILAGHDCSDGGLITTLLEMAFAGNVGIKININTEEIDPIKVFFAEEPGVVFEYMPENEEKIMKILKKQGIIAKIIGFPKKDKMIIVNHNGKEVLKEEMIILREIWEETSHQIEKLQAEYDCAIEEKEAIRKRSIPSYKLTFTPEPTPPEIFIKKAKPKIAILREEGSNGDREMASAFWKAGFQVWDITMTDFLKENITLSSFKGIAFVGGFSYADVLGAAKGWAGTVKFNKKIHEEFENFYQRQDTFSLGVCNGCQLMARLGWIPYKQEKEDEQVRFLRNRSGRFESRFATVKIFPSPSIMLKDMEGSILGIWIAHAEGRLHFPNKKIAKYVTKMSLAPIRYVDDKGEISNVYPFNPNGSDNAIAGLCSVDGRHLAMMPHPERTFLKWQWAWMPQQWKKTLKVSPWLKMFQNAMKWCEQK